MKVFVKAISSFQQGNNDIVRDDTVPHELEMSKHYTLTLIAERLSGEVK